MTKSKSNSETSSRASHWLDAMITVGVILLVVLAPLPLGSVNRWSAEFLLAGALVLFALWALRCALTGTLRICRTRVWWFMGGFLLLGVFQTLPLPTGVVQTLSPKTREIQTVAETAPFALNLEGETPDEPQTTTEAAATTDSSPRTSTLSVSAWASQNELRRLLLFALITWVIANTFTQRWQVFALTTAIIAIGAFEALYGLGEQFSGHKHIFWMSRTYHLFAAAGTFVNKNHFCGFVGMALLLAIGLWMGVRIDRRKGGGGSSNLGWRVRLGLMLSNARTAQMLGLSLAVAVLIFGVLFSISRAGIVLSLSVAVLLLLWTAYDAGLQSNTVLLLGVLGGIALAASAIGLDLVATHLESAASGEDASWLMRQAMFALGLDYFRDFPIFGSGLGTGKWTVFAYQGAYFGDIWADYLHNDWLQIACEAGVLGIMLAAVGAAVFVFETVRGTQLARNPMGRWIGRGALAAVVYMLLHSLFDFNLSKITSNGLLFACMIGLALAAPRLPRSSRRRRSSKSRSSDAEREDSGWLVIPMSALVPRAGVLLAGVGLLAVLLPTCVRAIRTDYNLSLYLAGIDRTGAYYFPLRPASERNIGRDAGKQALQRAVQASPAHPMAQYWKGRDILVEARREEEQLARSLAINVLPELADEENEDALKSLIPAFMPTAQRQLQKDRQKTVPAGLDCLQRMAMQVPSYPWTYNHAAELRQLLFDADSEVTVELARRALSLAPHKPAILSRGAIVLLESVLRDSASTTTILDSTESVVRQNRYALLEEWLEEGIPSAQSPEQRSALALMAASKALIGNADLSKELFPLLHRLADDTNVVRKITPETIRAQERLYAYLHRQNELVAALEVLDRIEEQVRKFGNAGAGTRMTYARGTDPRDDHEILSSVYRRKARVHARLGQFSAYRTVLGNLRAAVRPALAERCRSIEHLRGLGRRREAFEKSRDLLQSYWWYTPARVLAAELADLPAVRADAPPFQSALDHVYRAILWHTPALCRPQIPADDLPESRQSDTLISPISRQYVQRLRAVLNHAEDPENPSLMHSLCATLLPAMSDNAGASEQEEAIKTLASLSRDNKSLLPHHRIGHLLPFYIGILHEHLGNKHAASAAYRETLDISPRHLPALLRLVTVEDVDPLETAVHEAEIPPRRPQFQSQSPHPMPERDPLQKRLDELLPDNPVMATFGGRLLFLGAEQREVETTKSNRYGIEESQTRAETTYYWMPLDRFHNQYAPWIRYDDANKQLILYDGHFIEDDALDRTINETARPGSVWTVQRNRPGIILTSDSMKVGSRTRKGMQNLPRWMQADDQRANLRLSLPNAVTDRGRRKNSQ